MFRRKKLILYFGSGLKLWSESFQADLRRSAGGERRTDPVRDIASCIEMRKAVSFEADPVSLDLVISRILAAICQKKLQNSCFDLLDKMECRQPHSFAMSISCTSGTSVSFFSSLSLAEDSPDRHDQLGIRMMSRKSVNLL